MKSPSKIFGTALTFILSTACTVTVGSGSGDDSDDLNFSDKTEDPETSDTSSESDESSDTAETQTSEAETSETETSGATSSESPASSSSAGSSTSEPGTSSSGDTTSTPLNACDAEPAEGSCEECLNLSCQAEWQACCAADGCVETWTAIYSCVVDNATDDPLNDFDQCAAGASDTGDALDLPYEVADLTSCVNLEFSGDPSSDPLARQAGDGTCTLACYLVPTLFPSE